MNKSRIKRKLTLNNKTLVRLSGGAIFGRKKKKQEDPCTWNSSCPSSACESVQNDTCPNDVEIRPRF